MDMLTGRWVYHVFQTSPQLTGLSEPFGAFKYNPTYMTNGDEIACYMALASPHTVNTCIQLTEYASVNS